MSSTKKPPGAARQFTFLAADDHGRAQAKDRKLIRSECMKGRGNRLGKHEAVKSRQGGDQGSGARRTLDSQTTTADQQATPAVASNVPRVPTLVPCLFPFPFRDKGLESTALWTAARDAAQTPTTSSFLGSPAQSASSRPGFELGYPREEEDHEEESLDLPLFPQTFPAWSGAAVPRLPTGLSCVRFACEVDQDDRFLLHYCTSILDPYTISHSSFSQFFSYFLPSFILFFFCFFSLPYSLFPLYNFQVCYPILSFRFFSFLFFFFHKRGLS
jgi:hypothetical protein